MRTTASINFSRDLNIKELELLKTECEQILAELYSKNPIYTKKKI